VRKREKEKKWECAERVVGYSGVCWCDGDAFSKSGCKKMYLVVV